MVFPVCGGGYSPVSGGGPGGVRGGFPAPGWCLGRFVAGLPPLRRRCQYFVSQVCRRCVAGPLFCRRSAAVASQVPVLCVAGLGPKCRRSSFFRRPATLFGLLCFLASQVGRFLGTCDGTPPLLQRCPFSPATVRSPTCDGARSPWEKNTRNRLAPGVENV